MIIIIEIYWYELKKQKTKRWIEKSHHVSTFVAYLKKIRNFIHFQTRINFDNFLFRYLEYFKRLKMSSLSSILNEYSNLWITQIRSGDFFFRKKRIDSDESESDSGKTKLARVLNTFDLTALGKQRFIETSLFLYNFRNFPILFHRHRQYTWCWHLRFGWWCFEKCRWSLDYPLIYNSGRGFRASRLMLCWVRCARAQNRLGLRLHLRNNWRISGVRNRLEFNFGICNRNV